MTSGVFKDIFVGLDTLFFRDAFRIFDRNKDGFIDMSELRKMFAMVNSKHHGVVHMNNLHMIHCMVSGGRNVQQRGDGGIHDGG